MKRRTFIFTFLSFCTLGVTRLTLLSDDKKYIKNDYMKSILLKLNYKKKVNQKNNIKKSNFLLKNRNKKISEDFINSNTLNIEGWIFSEYEVLY